MHARLNAAAEEARSAESADIRNVLLDLTSFASIKSGVQPVLASGLPIDVRLLHQSITLHELIAHLYEMCPQVLILNAAAPTGTLDKRTMTQDGWEMHWGMNHLGHFLLTALLFPQLQNRPSSEGARAEFPRIIVVSSRAHRASAIRFDDVNFSSRPEEYGAPVRRDVQFPIPAHSRARSVLICSPSNSLRRKQDGEHSFYARIGAPPQGWELGHTRVFAHARSNHVERRERFFPGEYGQTRCAFC